MAVATPKGALDCVLKGVYNVQSVPFTADTYGREH